MKVLVCGVLAFSFYLCAWETFASWLYQRPLSGGAAFTSTISNMVFGGAALWTAFIAFRHRKP